MQVPMQLNAEDWVDQYADALFHFAKARVKDKAVAEDLVQSEATKRRIKEKLRSIR
jgi:DNA-directed RNA polymerase specialized sigma24 family protein